MKVEEDPGSKGRTEFTETWIIDPSSPGYYNIVVVIIPRPNKACEAAAVLCSWRLLSEGANGNL